VDQRGVEPLTSPVRGVRGPICRPAAFPVFPAQRPFSIVHDIPLETPVFRCDVDQMWTSKSAAVSSHPATILRGRARVAPEEPCSRRSPSPPDTGCRGSILVPSRDTLTLSLRRGCTEMAETSCGNTWQGTPTWGERGEREGE
jgi:hypothetical protein